MMSRIYRIKEKYEQAFSVENFVQVSEAEIDEYEQEYNLFLPMEFRLFLTHIGCEIPGLLKDLKHIRAHEFVCTSTDEMVPSSIEIFKHGRFWDESLSLIVCGENTGRILYSNSVFGEEILPAPDFLAYAEWWADEYLAGYKYEIKYHEDPYNRCVPPTIPHLPIERYKIDYGSEENILSMLANKKISSVDKRWGLKSLGAFDKISAETAQELHKYFHCTDNVVKQQLITMKPNATNDDIEKWLNDSDVNIREAAIKLVKHQAPYRKRFIDKICTLPEYAATSIFHCLVNALDGRVSQPARYLSQAEMLIIIRDCKYESIIKPLIAHYDSWVDEKDLLSRLSGNPFYLHEVLTVVQQQKLAFVLSDALETCAKHLNLKFGSFVGMMIDTIHKLDYTPGWQQIADWAHNHEDAKIREFMAFALDFYE